MTDLPKSEHDPAPDSPASAEAGDETPQTAGLAADDLGDGAVPDADTSTEAPDEDAPDA